jgi:phosphoglycolate phosphatase
MYQVLFFDLDGTLLDTLTDIRAAINDALKECGFSYSFSKQECRSLIGNGADIFIHKALKDQDSLDNFLKLKASYMPKYKDYQGKHTKPFNGVEPTLRFLAQRGIRLFVCSNKPDELAQLIVTRFYGNALFTEIRGNREGEKVKPDPHIVEYFLEKYALPKESSLFVGDSLPDLLTAQNAGLPLCLCTWGYGSYKADLLNECRYVIQKPKELVSIVL